MLESGAKSGPMDRHRCAVLEPILRRIEAHVFAAERFKDGRWHDEVSAGDDRPETDVEG